jgi:hypothetical protein
VFSRLNILVQSLFSSMADQSGKKRVAAEQEPPATGSSRSSTDPPEDDSKKKYSTPGAGSRARRKKARADQEQRNIQRTERNMPVPTCSLSVQVKWEQQLQEANHMRQQSTVQVDEEEHRWREALSVPALPGSMVLPSYIPPHSTFVAPQVMHSPRPKWGSGVPDCPQPGQMLSGEAPTAKQPAQMPPRPKWGSVVPDCPQPGQMLSGEAPTATQPAQGPHVPNTVPLFRGRFQGATMYGSGLQLGVAMMHGSGIKVGNGIPFKPADGGKGVDKSLQSAGTVPATGSVAPATGSAAPATGSAVPATVGSVPVTGGGASASGGAVPKAPAT